ncbi:MAG: BofC C-terminal domain-containing protein [Firmicutes bacterium]|nr:BofC C-terminal domain-containing protein [Bacillota bacterium]
MRLRGRAFWWAAGLLLAGALVVGGGTAGYLALSGRAPETPAQESTAAQAQRAETRSLAGADRGQIRIRPGAVVERRLFYTFDQHQVVQLVPVPPAWVGLSLEELRRRHPEAVITADDPRRLVWWQSVQGFCPEDAAARYVGIDGEQIAVFQGRPGMRRIVVQRTGIPIRWMPDEEIRRLQQGIPAATPQELQEILQGLASISGK